MLDTENFRIEQSHRTQVPNGAVTFSVVPLKQDQGDLAYKWSSKPEPKDPFDYTDRAEVVWTAPGTPALYTVAVEISRPSTQPGSSRGRSAASANPDDKIRLSTEVEITPMAFPREVLGAIDKGVQVIKDGLPGPQIRLQRQLAPLSPQKSLWVILRNRSTALSFNNYKAFVDSVMCGRSQRDGREIPETVRDHLQFDPDKLRFRGVESYEILKKATEAFLMHETGVLPMPEVTPLPDDPAERESFFAKQRARFPLGDNPGEEKRRLPQLEGTTDEEIREELENNRKAYLEALQEESLTFPYFKLIGDRLSDIPLKPPGAESEGCYGILRSRISPPILLELIWSYWKEEGMLVQTLKAISMRFQNRAYNVDKDGSNPLANVNLDPLRPLSNIIWGYIQDEHNRLTLPRRAYEYDHHYGFTIAGKAVPKLNPADSRTQFLEAFHTLLHRTSAFYKEESDTTKTPDGYPLLNGLKECHLLLAAGYHNAAFELTWTARIEMLIEQWLLARPETRDFLNRRVMVPYPEEWMPAVDQMMDLQGWRRGSVRHYRDLGVFGEMILLSIRYGNWSDNFDENEAKVWAQYWRQEIQGYINAYRAVTSVDLSADADAASTALTRRRAMQPSTLLARRKPMVGAAK